MLLKTFFLGLALLIAGLVSFFIDILPPDPLVNEINQLRDTPLTISRKLTVGAAERARTLSETGEWSHNGYFDVIRDYTKGASGENLSRLTENETVEAWLDSPTHKDNLLNPDFTKAGVGRYEGIIVVWFGESFP